MKISNKAIHPAALLSIFALLNTTLLGCDNSENGMKTPPKLTPQQEQANLEQRIQAIQNNPNIPAQTKEMTIAQMRGAATKPPPNHPTANK